MTTSIMNPIGYLLLRWRSLVALLGGILAAMVMLFFALSGESGAQTPVEPVQNFLVAGATHSLAVTSDGHVYAWGGGFNGQLGVNSNNDHETPVQVHGAGNEGYLSDIKDVGAGTYRSIALKSDGTVWAWGENSDGELGVDFTTLDLPVQTPKQVYESLYFKDKRFLLGVTNVDDGAIHSLAVKSNGTVWAWGDDYHCQTGAGYECGFYLSDAEQVKNLPTGVSVVDVVGGGFHSLALMSNGTVYAWGEGGHGQLGVHSNNDHNTAVQVHGPGNVGYLSGVQAIAAGNNHSLALMEDGTVYAWGSNDYGQLGIGNKDNHTVPYQVHGSGNVDYLSGITAVAAGEHHSMALRNDGTVWAWGGNGHGQLGIGNEDNHTVPYPVHGPGNVGYLSGVTDVEAGKFFSLALGNGGTVWAWGENANGQLGIGNRDDHTVPYQVHGGQQGTQYLTGIGPATASKPPVEPVDGKYPICRKSGTPKEQTRYVPESALKGHLLHGVTLGECP